MQLLTYRIDCLNLAQVVDFEEWMVDPVTQSCRTGVTLTLHGSQLGKTYLFLSPCRLYRPSAAQVFN